MFPYCDSFEFAEVKTRSTESTIDSESPSGDRFVALKFFMVECITKCAIIYR